MTTPPLAPPGPRGPGLLAPASIAALAATVLQVGWLERVKARLVAAGAVTRATLADAVPATVGVDGVLATLALLLAAFLAVRAARAAARGPAGLASLVPATALGRLGLMLLTTWTFVRWHASPGALVGFDLDLHAAHTALVADELRAGRFPSWTDAWYLGFPLLRFYGATFYLPAAGLAAALDDVRVAVKVVTAAWQLLAAPAAYALARATGATRGHAMLAGVAYAACPFFVNTLAHLGSLTAAPVIALAPAALAASIRAGRGEGLRHGVLLGAAGALLVGAHPAYAVQVAVLCGLAFVATAVVAAPRAGRVVVAGVAAAVVAVLGAAPVLAAWAFDGLPRAGTAPGAFELVRPGRPNPEALRFLVAWSPRPEVTATGYLGLATLLFAALGLVARRDGPRRAGLAVLLAATVVSWCGPGFVRERALLLLPAVLVPAVAAGVGALRRPGLAVVGIVLLLGDLGIGNLASPYRADLAPLAGDQRALAARLGRERAILVATDAEGRATAGEWQVAPETPLRTFLGGFREAAPATYDAMRATVEAAAEDRGVEDPAFRRHLELLGGATVATLAHGRVATTARAPAASSVGFATGLASLRADGVPGPDQVLAWSAAMAPPRGSGPGVLRRVLVAGDGPALPGDEPETPLEGVRVVADVRAGPTRTTTVEVPAAGWLRFDAAWTRDLVVTVAEDRGPAGLAVPSPGAARPDVMGLVLVPVPAAGRYVVTLRHPDRFAWWPASAVAALFAAVSLVARRRGGRDAAAT